MSDYTYCICDYCGKGLRDHLQMCCGELHNHKYGDTDEEKEEIKQTEIDAKTQRLRDDSLTEG